jgi:NitT/TauT family transport system substrate-binding protein
MKYVIFTVLILLCVLPACRRERNAAGEVSEVRIPRGAGGVGFLPLLVMEEKNLIQTHAREAGIALSVTWIPLGGPSNVNQALLSGSADFVAAGPPAFLVLWDKTRDKEKVMGVAALSSLPMYLNTREERLKKLDDVSDKDRIAVTATGVSIPAIIMQMYAKGKYGPSAWDRFDRFMVPMGHGDGVNALLSGGGNINAHFTSPPYHQRERKDRRIRTIMTSNEVMGGSTTFTMLYSTTEFREENPKVYKAVRGALEEAISIILADKKKALELDTDFSSEEILAVLNDPDVRFTTTPENVMKYAEFMHGVDLIKTLPGSWKDLFFPETHSASGS